ncbi:hypothetical protein J2X12_001945 [Pseudarthrobacter oxydans]|uniref:Uncharacterized protein n=1 Tax=Pseudarthrobacter oxydans TaxID=1671 RepID=A0AAW8NC84_PSEOX|nr:hypothetical protein [Pseudarthrobacter oxydans]
MLKPQLMFLNDTTVDLIPRWENSLNVVRSGPSSRYFTLAR